ncbi:MAG: hypothetical protein H7Z37_03245, partial [Pyrinomonadaceae bacterium]|nr:hypothetical protein [Pyrinomonadaceae bacterium]
VFKNLVDDEPSEKIGLYQGELIASLELHEKWRHLRGNSNIKWRSGIKHDCSKVMELKKIGDKYQNGFGELVELEDDYVYPLLKSSDVANDAIIPRRFVIVTQKKVGQETFSIEQNAPQTWNYLMKYAGLLDNRGSSIYQNKPRFAMFGIGDYSFAKWKVAISGFYKKLFFAAVGEHENKPIMLDDTCYFIACESKTEAENLAFQLNSSAAKEFFESFVFWDAKRPITSQLLQKLDLAKLLRELNKQNSTQEVENLRDGKRETFDAENLRKQWRKEKRAARKSANASSAD